MPVSCSQCGTGNRPGAKYCDECAAPLTLTSPRAVTGTARPQTVESPGIVDGEQADAATLRPSTNALPDGERKMVTALFADINGSMELMENLDPEEARTILDPALKLMIDAVRRNDGYLVQSTGDGIFALFGTPIAHEDQPQRAVYGALRLQDAIHAYSSKLVAEGGIPLEARAMLAEVYNWFTEGFDTKDLEEARLCLMN